MHRLLDLSRDAVHPPGIRAVLVTALATVVAALVWLGTMEIEPAALLRGHLVDLTEWHGRSPVQVVCAFCAVFCLMSALAIPGCSVLALGAGAVFGVIGGTLAVVLASAAGASLSFAVARRYARPVLRRRYATRLAAIDTGLARDGVLYLFTLRMAPVVPYALLNPLMGVTAMPAWTFFWVSALGMLAGSALYAFAGAGIAQWSHAAEAMPSAAMLALLTLLTAVPWGWRWMMRRSTCTQRLRQQGSVR